MRSTTWVLIVMASALLAGCVTPAPTADTHLLDVLRDGSASKEAIVLKFGQPSAVLEGGRILTYRLGGEPRHGYFIREARADNWSALRYSLVLIFDENDVLQRHALVPVR